jgi:hypothetical protein
MFTIKRLEHDFKNFSFLIICGVFIIPLGEKGKAKEK